MEIAEIHRCRYTNKSTDICMYSIYGALYEVTYPGFGILFPLNKK